MCVGCSLLCCFSLTLQQSQLLSLQISFCKCFVSPIFTHAPAFSTCMMFSLNHPPPRLPNCPIGKQHMYDDIVASDGPSSHLSEHTFSSIPHHKRTHSASSTTSSHTSGIPVKSHMSTCMNGGHSMVTKNPVAAMNSYTGSVTDKPGMFRPHYAQKGWFSSPIVSENRSAGWICFSGIFDAGLCVFWRIKCGLFVVQ